MYFGQFQRSINVFLKRRIASDLPFQPSSLLVSSRIKVRVLVALGIYKVFRFIIVN